MVDKLVPNEQPTIGNMLIVCVFENKQVATKYKEKKTEK